jgi:hypothetical protein
VDFKALGQLILKQDDQKADNAEIPTHLWDLVFQETLPKDFPLLHPKWRERLDNYREMGLWYWRLCLVHSFWWHLEQQLANNLWKQQPHPRTAVHWAPGERKYEWRKGKGRERCKKWMAQLRMHPMAEGDWIPAKDCFQKAAAAL